MLLKICLIVAILGAGAVVAVNFVMVQPAIVKTITERETEKKAKVVALSERDKNKKDLDATRVTLGTTSNNLVKTTQELKAANTKITGLQSETNALREELTKAESARDAAQGELSEWRQLHLSPQQVVDLTNSLKKITMDFAGASQETVLLKAENERIQRELDKVTLTNRAEEVILPDGLSGKIVVVDPKYDFVILNIGEDKGVLPKGIMMVSRDGRLIGKVQIVSVTTTQSVANIMPAWRRADVMEGDEVVYKTPR
jgi:co-chaperonin GroES (HSP10)